MVERQLSHVAIGIIRPYAPRTQVGKSGKKMYWDGIEETILWPSVVVVVIIQGVVIVPVVIVPVVVVPVIIVPAVMLWNQNIDTKGDLSDDMDNPRVGVEEFARAL